MLSVQRAGSCEGAALTLSRTMLATGARSTDLTRVGIEPTAL